MQSSLLVDEYVASSEYLIQCAELFTGYSDALVKFCQQKVKQQNDRCGLLINI